MKNYQRQFLEFAIETGALCFGEFELKSGRTSPYFFNTGLFSDGASAARLGNFYADLIADNVDGDFMLYGPAYKGIPLATAAAMALATRHDRNVAFAFNRKEAKDHGEGGNVVGAPLSGNVVIVDDVITAGLSINESVQIIEAASARPTAVAITLDRQEKVQNESFSAVSRVSKRYGMPVHAVANVGHLVSFLRESAEQSAQCPPVTANNRFYSSALRGLSLRWHYRQPGLRIRIPLSSAKPGNPL